MLADERTLLTNIIIDLSIDVLAGVEQAAQSWDSGWKQILEYIEVALGTSLSHSD